jgi:hypothetical protein
MFLFEIQCFFQSGSECGPWTKIIGISCFVIQKIHFDFLWFSYLFGEVWSAQIYAICWNITTYKNMDVKLLHPVWKDFLDTVNTVVLTWYWKQLIIFLFDIQCFFQSGSECGPWTKIIGNSCLVILKIHLDFFMIFLFSM